MAPRSQSGSSYQVRRFRVSTAALTGPPGFLQSSFRSNASNPPTRMTISALIIDDEQLARDELKYLLDQAGGVDVVAQGTNGIEALELIDEYHPDLVFLDVQMPGLDGFAVIQRLMDRKRAKPGSANGNGADPLPQIVFATAYDQYAVRAFDVNAVDYLLKPFDLSASSRPSKKSADARRRHSRHRRRASRVADRRSSCSSSTAPRAPRAHPNRPSSSCRPKAVCCWSIRVKFATRPSTRASSASPPRASKATPNAALWRNSLTCSTPPSSGAPIADSSSTSTTSAKWSPGSSQPTSYA
jgi:CheY-like chemotaxis protein